MKGIIFDTKRMALHDGPGIRQTVFFKGCPLSCHWCHNPESRSKEIECIRITEKINGKEVADMETIGSEVSVDELLQHILRDILIYEESGGGVTFSGGEPLMQPEFLFQMLKQCRQHEIHTCVDTTGFASQKTLERIAPFTDLFLYDLKHPDNKKHQLFTGVENTQILQNLYFLDDMEQQIQIRIPLIPNINDEESDLLRFLDILHKLKQKPIVSLLPYHKIGSHKYNRFHLPYHMQDIEEPTEAAIASAKQIFEHAGYFVNLGG